MRLDPSGKTWITVPLMHFLLGKKKCATHESYIQKHAVKVALKVAYTWLDWPDNVKNENNEKKKF